MEVINIDNKLWLEESRKLAAQSPKYHYNNKAYIVVRNSANATHWMALEDDRWKDDPEVNITPNKMYRILYDQYEDEIVIIDDKENLSMEYMSHHGEWVVMEDSDRWMDYVKRKWQVEYKKTDGHCT